MRTTTQSRSTTSTPASSSRRPARKGPLGLLARYPWVLACLALVALGATLAFWARTSPGYDPYGWLVWGYQAIRLHLNLAGAPSWKPMPFLFTVPYALFGHLEYRLWMVTAVSVSLGGPVLAGHIVYRLVRADSRRRWPALAGALFATVALAGIVQYFHYILSVQSDPMLVTLVLLAIDLHMSGRHRWAFAALWLASLGRPETWPFIGLYSIWAWRAVPSMRKLILAGLFLIAFMWFGFPLLSGNSPLTSADLAQNSPRRLLGNKITGTLTRFHDLSYWPVFAAAAVGLALAASRRDWTVLVIGAASALWVLVEIAFALKGYPAVPRYMFEAAAAMIVVAGVGVGWTLQAAADAIIPESAGAPAPPAAPKPKRSKRWVPPGGALVVAVLIGFLIPDIAAGINWERHDLVHERARTTEINRMDAAIKALGGYRHIRYCGRPAVGVAYASILAWYTKLNVGKIGFEENIDKYVETGATIWFAPLPNGWVLNGYHVQASKRASCANLVNAFYIVTPHHPHGFVLHGTA
ncbi:MAG: hypothetical protein ACLP0J_15125 [Solirubrobacteraceae bacterium]